MPPSAGRLPPGSTPPRVARGDAVPMVRSGWIEALEARVSDGDAAAVRDFWDEVGACGTPLVESAGDGACAVTFLWRGQGAAVLLLANKLFDRANPRGGLMARVPGTDVWHLTYRLPADWRGSYQIAVAATEPGDNEELRALAASGRPDPFNDTVLPQPSGAPAKSVAELPGAPAQPYLSPRTGVPAGRVTGERIGGRDAWLYTPPRRDDGELPLLVLLDGDIWARRIPVFPTLDNLIADGAIPPLAAVVLAAGDRVTRFTEYPCQEPFAAFLAGELTPWAAARLGATADPARTIMAGQSLGGLAAAFAAYRAPHRFGNVLTQSGSFWWPGNDPARAEWLTRQYATTDRLPLRFYQEVGTDEWVGLGPNRRLRDALRAKGYPVTYREFSGGHDQVCWRGGLADGLRALAGDWH